MKRLRILTLIALLLCWTIRLFKLEPIFTKTSSKQGEKIIPSSWHKQVQSRLSEEHIRPADQTFLTFPEWFLVHSPAEQARFFKHSTSTNFPYMAHVKQLWDSYEIVSNEIEGIHPHNDEYHTMIKVIGISTHIEYALKAMYESIVGRITLPKTGKLTQEDKFNAAYMNEYVNFINYTPWYEFDYGKQLKKLWLNTDFFGSNLLRKLERKYLLTSEFVVKYLYAKLIKLGTKTAYGTEELTTSAIVSGSKEDLSDKNIEYVESYTDSTHLIKLPRYYPFKKEAHHLAKNQKFNFKEIAGNSSVILVSLLVKEDFDFLSNSTKILFEQPVVSDLNYKRILFATPVNQLATIIGGLDYGQIEHVYDF